MRGIFRANQVSPQNSWKIQIPNNPIDPMKVIIGLSPSWENLGILKSLFPAMKVL